MSFFKGVIGAFKDAVKAGSDFNPVLEDVLAKLEVFMRRERLIAFYTRQNRHSLQSMRPIKLKAFTPMR